MYRQDNHWAEDWYFNVIAFVKDARYIEIRSDMVSKFDESDTSAGYKDVGYIIYIYYNTSWVVNNVVTRNAWWLPEWGTTGQVLTKTATWAKWWDSEWGMKVFSVSWTADLTNIQAAYDYMRTGKKCIISMAGYWEFYPHYRWAQWTLVWWLGTDWTYAETEPLKWYFVVTLFLNISWGTVTQARIVSQTQQIVTSLPDNPQANTLYFITE